MEKQKGFRPIFDPEQVDEQVEYLARIHDLQTQKLTPGACTVAELRRITSENEQIIANVWTQLLLHEAVGQIPENESNGVGLVVFRQRKDSMPETEFTPQWNTIESQSKPTPHRRYFALVAALLIVLYVGSFLTVLRLIHANGTLASSSPHTTISSHPTAQSALPVPSIQIIQGPASQVVYSVGISNRVDPKTGMVPVEINQFTVGETIQLSCSARPPKDGMLTVQWYSNGSLYRHNDILLLHAKGQQTATIPIVYGLPTEGKAEVYWNNQLAAIVLFVVEPAISHA